MAGCTAHSGIYTRIESGIETRDTPKGVLPLCRWPPPGLSTLDSNSNSKSDLDSCRVLDASLVVDDTSVWNV